METYKTLRELFMTLCNTEVDTAVILGHINPDGDAVGSVMGVAYYLRALPKGCRTMWSRTRRLTPLHCWKGASRRIGPMLPLPATAQRRTALPVRNGSGGQRSG